MTRSTAITRTRGRRSALAYGSRSTTAAEDNLNRLGTPRAGTLLKAVARTDGNYGATILRENLVGMAGYRS